MKTLKLQTKPQNHQEEIELNSYLKDENALELIPKPNTLISQALILFNFPKAPQASMALRINEGGRKGAAEFLFPLISQSF